jgi:hypothetical protein
MTPYITVPTTAHSLCLHSFMWPNSETKAQTSCNFPVFTTVDSERSHFALLHRSVNEVGRFQLFEGRESTASTFRVTELVQINSEMTR